MTKTFLNKVLSEGIVDTKQYRYRLVTKDSHDQQWREILRLPLDWLDTTAAIDGWLTVWSDRPQI